LNGAIALVERGVCNFSIKTLLAGSKGAVATIIFNDLRALGGTLGAEDPAYPLTAMIPRPAGLAIVEKLKKGPLTASFEISIFTGPTYNVLAQTKGGDQNNVLLAGAHSDSVPAGKLFSLISGFFL
jgi:acetylornithine deacetylase/succinyl-diaminopimelate desuccinylase-like protein